MNRQIKGVALILMGVLLAVADVELDTEILTFLAVLLGGGGLYQVFSQENQGGQPGGDSQSNDGEKKP